MNGIEEYEDAFGNHLVRTTNNDADLAAHYRFSPERYRFYRNDERELLLYEIEQNDDLSSYPYLSDARPGEEDAFILQPDPGDTLTFKTAERFRYTVGFVQELGAAFALSQRLTNPNDRFEMGLSTGKNTESFSDGYFFRHTSEHDFNQGDFFERRNGNIIGDVETVSLKKAMDYFRRVALEYNWYNVGEEDWTETYTTAKDGQLNIQSAVTTTEEDDENAGFGGRGPISGNGHIAVQVEADPATTDLEVYVGSFSILTEGATRDILRGKGFEKVGYEPTQSGSWEAMYAIRADPNRPNVAMELRGLEITQGSAKVLVVACDPSNVLAADGNPLSDDDFYTPEEQSKANSVLEVTDLGVVEEWPNESGVLGSVHDNPGGYQTMFSTSRTTSLQGNQSATRTGSSREKHGIWDGDLGVVVAKPQSTDTISTLLPGEQDW